MYSIQTLNKISSKGLDILPREEFEVASEIKNPAGIILRSFKMHDMEIPVSVKGIARAGAGVNNIPVDLCTEKGIVVFNTPGANANSVKELVLTGIFMSSRKIYRAIEWAKGLKDKGSEVPKLVEKGKSNFIGPEVKGKRLGVIGLGAIGVMVANAATELGMEVYGFDPFISVEAAWGLSRKVHRAKSADEIYSESDYITLHVPLNEKTKGLLCADKFSIMKKGMKVLNFARGGLVNNVDLLEAIENGIVDRYVTDFPDQELLNVEDVIPIPHLGASTPEAEDNCAVMAAEQLKAFLEEGVIKNSVNFPNCDLSYGGKTYRLLIANKNIPNMVGQISTSLAESGLNILEMINKHKNDLAYNIIDLDSKVSAEAFEKIKNIEGVLMVRIIEPVNK